jgi:outer membrane protein TolC
MALFSAVAHCENAEPTTVGQWPMVDFIERVLTGDPSVTAAHERETSAQAKYDRLWMEYLPDLKVGATSVMFDGSPISSFSLHGIDEDGITAREVHWGSFGSASAIVSVPLWGPKAPGRDLAETRQIALKTSQEQTTAKQRDIALKASTLAIEREQTLTLLPLWKDSFENLSKQEKLLQELLKSGESSPSDVIEISNRRSEVELALAHGSDQATSLGRLLAVWLGDAPLPITARIAPPRGDLTWATDSGRLQTLLTEQSPDLKILELAVKGSKSKINALRLRNLPDVELAGSYVTGTSYQKNQAQLVTVGITVSIPITTGLRNSRDLVDALRERRAQENDVAAQRREIESLAIELAYKIRSQIEDLKSSERMIALRQSQLNETEERSKGGSVSSKQVLEARQGLIDAKIDRANKLFAFYTLWCQLAIQTGSQRSL